LPAPEVAPRPGRRAGRNTLERTLCTLVAELLGLPEVGVEDSFFDLGGDSILAMQLVTRARAAGIGLTTRDVFAHGTVEALAAAAGTVAPSRVADDAGTRPATPPWERFGPLLAARPDVVEVWPLSPLQQGLLFHALYDEGAPDTYVAQVWFDLDGP